MTLPEIVDHLEEYGEIPRREFMMGREKHSFFATVSGFALSGITLEDPESKRSASSWVRTPFAAGTPGNPLHKSDGVVAHVADLADPVPLGVPGRTVGDAIGGVGGATDAQHSEDKRDVKPRQIMLQNGIDNVTAGIELLETELEDQKEAQTDAAQAAEDAEDELRALRDQQNPAAEAANIDAAVDALEKANTDLEKAVAAVARKKKIISNEQTALTNLHRSLEESKRTVQNPRKRTAAFQRDVAQSRLELVATGAIPGGDTAVVKQQSPWITVYPVIYTQIKKAMHTIVNIIIPRGNGGHNKAATTLLGLMTHPKLSVPFTDMVRAYITVERDETGMLTRWARDSTMRAKSKITAEIAMEDAIFGGLRDPWLF